MRHARLLAAAEAGAPDDLQRARVDLLRGQLASASGAASEASAQLLKAAQRLEPLDVDLARGTYLDAWGATMFAGRLAQPGGSLLAVSRAARAAPPAPRPLGPSDLLLDGLAALIGRGASAAAPSLRRAVQAFRDDEASVEHGSNGACWPRRPRSPSGTSTAGTRWAPADRSPGAPGRWPRLSIALNGQAMIAVWFGDFEAAVVERRGRSAKQATGTQMAPYAAMLLAAFQGRTDESSALTDATIRDAVTGGEGLGIQIARWTTAILHNGFGRYNDALDAAEQATDEPPGLFISTWALPELIEAAVRSGNPRRAADALERLAATTAVGDADWAVGTEARSRALLSDGEAAEECYLEAIHRLGRTRLRPDLARAHLLYGEWLRRQNRRVDAREQLRIAHDHLVAMGMEAFAERAP